MIAIILRLDCETLEIKTSPHAAAPHPRKMKTVMLSEAKHLRRSREPARCFASLSMTVTSVFDTTEHFQST
jgi:hypothetical protein